MIVFILSLGFIAYGVACWVLYFQYRRRQFRPTHRDAQGKGQNPFQPWRTEDGLFLGYFRAASDPRRLVLFFHGGRGEALDRAWAGELVPSQDVLVLVEYPGYGARSGALSKTDLLADAEKIVEQARRRWGAIPILAVGEGLGSAVAAYLASVRKADRLALISPFASEEAMVRDRYRFFFFRWLLKDRYRTVDYLKNTDVPLHVVHGTMDEWVPLEHGRAVYQSYPGKEKVLDEVPGFGHLNIDQAILHSPFTARFRAFIR